MAVDLTAAQLLAALRLSDTTEETAQATRLLAFATATVERHLGAVQYAATPATILNEAVIRIAGYEFDKPTASRGTSHADSLRNSGAAEMLLPYRVHRAGTTAGAESSSSSSTGGPGVDQVARDAAAAAAATADQNRTFLATFMDRVRTIIEAVVPAWARAANPPTAEGGVSESRVRQIADEEVNQGIANGVQVPARAAPGNAINGKQQYFGADFYAPDAEHGEILKAHRNGSTFWEAESVIPAIMQVSPGLVDKTNVPDRFRVTIHTKPQAFPTGAKIRIAFLGVTQEIPYDPATIEHTANIVVTAAMRTAIAALATSGTGSETELTAIPLDKDDRVTGPGVIPGVALQVIAGKAGSSAAAGLTTAQQIALLALIVEPAVIAFASQAALEKAVKTVRLAIPNPELLEGDVWYEGEIQGQPALARTKWSSATAAITLTVSDPVAGNIATAVAADTELEVRLRFFDAAADGNELERIGRNVPLVRLSELSSLETRVEALEKAPAGGGVVDIHEIAAIPWDAGFSGWKVPDADRPALIAALTAAGPKFLVASIKASAHSLNGAILMTEESSNVWVGDMVETDLTTNFVGVAASISKGLVLFQVSAIPGDTAPSYVGSTLRLKLQGLT